MYSEHIFLSAFPLRVPRGSSLSRRVLAALQLVREAATEVLVAFATLTNSEQVHVLRD